VDDTYVWNVIVSDLDRLKMILLQALRLLAGQPKDEGRQRE
jgi:hypothetical protein